MSDDPHKHFVEELAAASLREKRAARRWGILFKSLLLLYIFTITWVSLAPMESSFDNKEEGEGHAAIIRIAGLIADGEDTASSLVNAQLREAFENKNAKGIILEINSPGGSAVESHRIYQEIRRLREKFPDKKVYAVAGDFCASGGYFIAAAADEIFADPASLIGSIGVIFSSFGFVEAMEKLGVERRVQTAGNSKNILDPFSQETIDGRAAIEGILQDIHQVFIDAVRQGRGERLRDDPDIFNGSIYSGNRSLEMGLIDGFDDIGGVARDKIGVEEIIYYSRQGEWWQIWADELGISLPTFHPSIQALPR